MPKDSDPAAPEWAPGSCPWVNTILPDPCAGLEAVDPFGWVVLCLARRRMGRGRMKWGATPLLAMCWPDCRSKREGRQGGRSVIAGSEAGTRELVSCGAQGQMPKLTGFLEKWARICQLSGKKAITCFPYLPGEQGLGRNLRGTGVFIRQTAFTTSTKQAVEGTRQVWHLERCELTVRLQAPAYNHQGESFLTGEGGKLVSSTGNYKTPCHLPL